MRLGIQTDTLDRNTCGRFGDETYKKLAEHGYAASDFNMSVTESPLYSMPFEEARAILLKENAMDRGAWWVHGVTKSRMVPVPEQQSMTNDDMTFI